MRLFVSPAQHHVKCPTETIQAEEGDDVTLRFDLDPRVNLEDYTLDVRRTDLDEVVHVYRHGKDHTDPQTERYRDRTTLIHEDLSRGIVTLQISSVQLKDSGPYQCFVPGLRAGCTTVLNVVKKVQHNKTRTDDVMTTTSPPNPDAQTVNVGAVVGGFLGAVGVLGFLCAPIGVLVKRGTIKVCKRTRGVAAAPEAVVMLRLKVAGGGDDLHGAEKRTS
ncbi:butyrophilin subfamily 2 member A1-like [Seriola dumerili]|uniref:butyrophilin subfamily 2 member A1-like n=1 Tax=Seriola dumerili TaxID=41447 RepID=UPI000BBEFAF4|nr:butyrophilin subfamily 2 member A1-like [Seriola dumerili]